jgi:hypothetical protein
METPPFSFLGRPLGPSFRATVVTLEPGATRVYDESEWQDALVIVESGTIDLECRAGGRLRFCAGAVLCFTGLGLRALHNAGGASVVLVAVSRRRPARGSGADAATT